MLQLWPVLLSEVDITTKPRPRAPTSSTSGAPPSLYAVPQPAPWVMKSFPFQAGCGAHGCQPLAGSNSTTILYCPRSSEPVSSRTMNGTVFPWSVVVVPTSDGGLCGL